MKKVLGQHFLRQVPKEILFPLNELEKIQSLQKPATIYIGEIGPGSGIVTKAIIEQILPFSHLTFHYELIDIDLDAINSTKEMLHSLELPARIKPHYIHKDVLKHDFLQIHHCNFSYIFGSLPYNISKKIVNACEQILSKKLSLPHVLPSRFIIQKEVAEDYVANAPSATFLGNRLALHSTYRRITKKIPPGAFFPPPKVESAVIEIGWDNAIPKSKRDALPHTIAIMRQGFNAKRKVLRSVFGKKLTTTSENVQYLLHLRAHELSIAQWEMLAEALPA